MFEKEGKEGMILVNPSAKQVGSEPAAMCFLLTVFLKFGSGIDRSSIPLYEIEDSAPVRYSTYLQIRIY